MECIHCDITFDLAFPLKVSEGESSHFEKNQFKVVQHVLGIFP